MTKRDRSLFSSNLEKDNTYKERSRLQIVTIDTTYGRSMLFRESQIICLEHQGTCLYGEVIQLILSRQMCWFRPICMTIKLVEGDRYTESFELIQLQFSSDLLWPINLFRPALDTEVISLLADLDNNHKQKPNKIPPRQYLNQFIRQVWAANKDKF